MYLKLNVNLVVCSMLLFMSLFSFFLFMYFMMTKKVMLLDYEVLFMNSKSVTMSIMLDWMSCSFISFVTLISFVVVFYSQSYMHNDNNLSMFIILVFLFVLSMLLLIISPNLISILLGWDGLGLISYCLVIYYKNNKSYNAGMLTAMTNRIGDVMILVGIAWMMNFGSWNYLFYFKIDYLIYNIIGVLIIIAAMTKSAQIPFSSWLPAAMAAPTPVSALVHSSTLVTAGVYLLIRFSSILLEMCEAMFILLLLSVLTMFMSGLGAIFEFDLKKIIALSTLSQLGLMISSLCMGMVDMAFFHLLTHALFKSLLFMCAGYMIHGMNDSQDIRTMGSLMLMSPILCIYFNISNLSLCGMPFLAGFYSKDMILEKILMNDFNTLIVILYFIATFFTVVYTFRLIFFSMVDNLKINSYYNYNDQDFIMLSSMMIMMLMVILGGSFMCWFIFLDFEGIFLEKSLKLLTLSICFLGLISGLYLSYMSNLNNKFLLKYNLNWMLGEMWFLPYLCTFSINYLILNLGYKYFKLVDSGWGEKAGGQGLYLYMITNSNYLMNLQSKKMVLMIYLYMFMFIIFIFL
uniref:NADH-ubiquinone oxidoreductase chain 5 n=1 Tax=Ectopsocopsis cryptomeriae TaxID=297975 RepID=A0A8K1ZFD6_9NEOP|nr:NADH dehydrogenase subunit 5 [Ectopsocopsis cryptomeriae]